MSWFRKIAARGPVRHRGKALRKRPLTEMEQQALKEFYAGQDEAVDGATGTGYDGEKETAYHAVDAAQKAQSVLKGIDITYTNPNSRFGKGFYVSVDGDTVIAELASHGSNAKYIIRYDMDLSDQKVLDLTDPQIAKQWGYYSGTSSLVKCQKVAQEALEKGYNVIKVGSYRDKGINYIIYSNFEEILSPQMVIPVEE